jgi:hypothetical protein
MFLRRIQGHMMVMTVSSGATGRCQRFGKDTFSIFSVEVALLVSAEMHIRRRFFSRNVDVYRRVCLVPEPKDHYHHHHHRCENLSSHKGCITSSNSVTEGLRRPGI